VQIRRSPHDVEVYPAKSVKKIADQVVTVTEEKSLYHTNGASHSHILIDLAATALHRLHASLLIELPRPKPNMIVAALSASFEPTYLSPALHTTKHTFNDRPASSCLAIRIV
jgi:hypothetical protein